MFFKLELNANLDFFTFDKEKDSVIFSFTDDDKTSVIIRRPTLEEQKIGHNKNQIFCTAKLKRIPDAETLDVFESLAKNKTPKGVKKSEFPDGYYSRYFDEVYNMRENHVLPLFVMPQPFQEYESIVHKKLLDYIKRTIKVLRWRKILDGSHEPIHSSRGFFWSFDEENWESMPQNTYIEIHQSSVSPITKEVQNEIQEMIVGGADEPLGHTLFREAWKQRKQNPRSALILGMVAIEVGFKQCVGILLPEAQWLAENVPSPPIPKMLSNLLPQLPAKLKIEGKILSPPKPIMKLLDTAMQKRNETTHKGNLPPKAEELEEMLLAIRDTLYLLDYYCGVSWALNNIRKETLTILHS